MPRRRPAELNVNHERWLVSYADFITLLFGFFVVMYSISQVSEGKYRALSETLVEAFSPAMRSARPAVPEDDSGMAPFFGTEFAAEQQARQQLQELSERFREQLAELTEQGLVQIDGNEYWLQIELQDSILFASGSADLNPEAHEIFTRLAQILRDYDNPVQVEGYTDNVPISTPRFPSNWELSAARASSVVKWLAGQGVAPQRLSAVGYGEYQPVASNATAEGRARNRRVALVIAREPLDRPGQAPDPALLDEVAVPETVMALEVTDEPSAQVPEEMPLDAVPREAFPLEPVQLEGGGLLFTSDPDLPRENRR